MSNDIHNLVWGLAYNWHGYSHDPIFFLKGRATIRMGTIGKIHLREDPMWPEVELAILVGEDPEGGLFPVGYSVANDVTVNEGGNLHLAKCKVGSDLLHIKPGWKKHYRSTIAMAINGRQAIREGLGNMILTPTRAVMWLGKYGLLPGDIILMGTPSRKENFYLQRNDVVSCYIEGIGEMVNHVL